MKPSVTTTSDPDSEALASLFSSDAEHEIGPVDEDEEDDEDAEKPAAKPADPERVLAELRSGLDQLEALLSR